MSDKVLVDILRAWETWPGISKEFYQLFGLSKAEMDALMGKAKKVSRDDPTEEFKEIQVEGCGNGFGQSFEMDMRTEKHKG